MQTWVKTVKPCNQTSKNIKLTYATYVPTLTSSMEGERMKKKSPDLGIWLAFLRYKLWVPLPPRTHVCLSYHFLILWLLGRYLWLHKKHFLDVITCLKTRLSSKQISGSRQVSISSIIKFYVNLKRINACNIIFNHRFINLTLAILT